MPLLYWRGWCCDRCFGGFFFTGHAVLWLFCNFVGVTLLAVDFVRMTVVENRLLLRILGLQIRYSVFCSLKLFVLLWEDIVYIGQILTLKRCVSSNKLQHWFSTLTPKSRVFCTFMHWIKFTKFNYMSQ